VDLGVERFAVRLEHEVRKAKSPLHLALTRLAAELERPERSLGLVGEQMGLVRERIAFVFSMVPARARLRTRIEPVFAEESLAAIIEESARAARGAARQRAARLAFTAEVDSGAERVVVDRFALLQALQNLLQNAREAYAEGTERLSVRVSARALRGGSEVELRVADDGVGVPPERIPSLFVPFGQQEARGTGVGSRSCAASRRRCTVGRWTSRAPRQGDDRDDGAPGEAGRVMPGHRILVVDDEPAVREIVCAILRSCGYHRHAVATVEERARGDRRGRVLRLRPRRAAPLNADDPKPLVTGGERLTLAARQTIRGGPRTGART